MKISSPSCWKPRVSLSCTDRRSGSVRISVFPTPRQPISLKTPAAAYSVSATACADRGREVYDEESGVRCDPGRALAPVAGLQHLCLNLCPSRATWPCSLDSPKGSARQFGSNSDPRGTTMSGRNWFLSTSALAGAFTLTVTALPVLAADVPSGTIPYEPPAPPPTEGLPAVSGINLKIDGFGGWSGKRHRVQRH